MRLITIGVLVAEYARILLLTAPTVGAAYELALNCTFHPNFYPLPKTVLSCDFGWA